MNALSNADLLGGEQAVEAILYSSEQPVLAIYDFGIETDMCGWPGKDDHRVHVAVSFPVLVDDSRTHFAITDDDCLITRNEAVGRKLANRDWGNRNHPSLRSIGLLPYFTSQKNLKQQVNISEVVATDDPIVAEQAAEELVDVLEQETPTPHVFLIGRAAILAAQRAFGVETEAEQPKEMPFYQFDYSLARDDEDLLSLTILSGLALEDRSQLWIPDEHRYRVLLNLSNFYSQRAVIDAREMDELKASNYEEDSKYPPHSVDRLMDAIWDRNPLRGLIHFSAHESMIIAKIMWTYGIGVEELVETVQRQWYAVQGWQEIDIRPAPNLVPELFHVPPNPGREDDFLASRIPDQINFYNKLIRKTVGATLNVEALVDYPRFNRP